MAETDKKAKLDTSRRLKCVGGPLSGSLLRVYPENSSDVRKGRAAIWSPVPMRGGAYEVTGNELHWEDQ